MIVVTGAAGFIGSNIIRGLNARGINEILAVDDLTDGDKFLNLVDLKISDYLHKDNFRNLILTNKINKPEVIFHQGACSDTTERDGHFMMDNNYRVTLELFEYAQAVQTPFIYASSAAVYGAGPNYKEDPACESPLNVYGYSKYLFDQVLRARMQSLTAQVVGLRYFNVYGPNEQHKDRMASVAFHNMNQYAIQKSVKLFGGWDGYDDGAQERDFIYIDDVVKVNLHFMDNPSISGIFNCGTGRAQPFNDVAQTVVNGLRKNFNQPELELEKLVQSGEIIYIPFPDDLKGRYQSHTQADLTNLRAAGYTEDFYDVQTGVSDYVSKMLAQGRLLKNH